MYWDPTDHLNMWQKSYWLKTLNGIFLSVLLFIISTSQLILVTFLWLILKPKKGITWRLQLHYKWKQGCWSLPTWTQQGCFPGLQQWSWSQNCWQSRELSLGQLCLYGTSAKAAENMKYCWIPGMAFPKNPFGIRMC